MLNFLPGILWKMVTSSVEIVAKDYFPSYNPISEGKNYKHKKLNYNKIKK